MCERAEKRRGEDVRSVLSDSSVEILECRSRSSSLGIERRSVVGGVVAWF